MIENLVLENFKGFEKIALTELKPITLISGKNNVGKSSVLEGIFLFMDHVAPDSFSKINRFRGMVAVSDSVNIWESMFYQMDSKRNLKISLTEDGVTSELEYVRDDSFIPVNDMNVPQDIMNQIISSAHTSYTLQFRYKRDEYTENGHFAISPVGSLRNMTTTNKDNRIEGMSLTQFINTEIISGSNMITEWLGKLELSGKKEQIVDALRIIDPAIQDLTTIVTGGQVQIYVRAGYQLLPLKLAGDGMNKLLYIVLAIITNPHSIVLVDEIETGFHYSMYQKLWEIIAWAARANECQVIATTHSYECIAAAIDGMAELDRSCDFCYIRIDKNDKGNYAHRYSDELLRTAIEAEMEVR